MIKTQMNGRRGMVAVETAIILATLLLLVFATFDLGLAALRFNSLSYAARNIARNAIVHGALAAPEFSGWGPNAIDGNAGDGSEIAGAALTLLPTMNARDVHIHVDWPDGDNREDDQVRVQLNYSHVPFAPFLLLSGPINLQAECTMCIVH